MPIERAGARKGHHQGLAVRVGVNIAGVAGVAIVDNRGEPDRRLVVVVAVERRVAAEHVAVGEPAQNYPVRMR